MCRAHRHRHTLCGISILFCPRFLPFASQTITIAVELLWLLLCLFYCASIVSASESKPKAIHSQSIVSVRRVQFIFFFISVVISSHSDYCWNVKQIRTHIVLFSFKVTIVWVEWKMFLFLGVLLATIIAYFLRFHYEIVHGFILSLKIDGPPAWPIIGNGLLFLNNSSSGNGFD